MNVVLNYHGRFDSFILSRMQEGENILWNEILREIEKLKIMGFWNVEEIEAIYII